MNGITRFEMQKQATQERIAEQLKRIADVLEKVAVIIAAIAPIDAPIGEMMKAFFNAKEEAAKKEARGLK